jgi:hypothetical protein
VLAHLKSSGTLETHKGISGRTNDKKKGKLATAWDESDIPQVGVLACLLACLRFVSWPCFDDTSCSPLYAPWLQCRLDRDFQ